MAAAQCFPPSSIKYSKLGVEVLHRERNLGKGAAQKTGIRYIRRHEQATSLVTADADGQHSPRDILRIVNLMGARPEALLLGVRNAGRMPIKSCLVNSITRFFFRLQTKLESLDTQTGLRGLPYPFFDRLLHVEGDGHAYEMNMLPACRNGMCRFVKFALIQFTYTTIPAHTFMRYMMAAGHYQRNRRMAFRAQTSICSAAGYFLLALCVMAAGSLMELYQRLTEMFSDTNVTIICLEKSKFSQ